jgi:hypothetical protein
MLNLMKSKKLYLIFFCLIIFLFASLFLRDESKDHYNFEEVSNAASHVVKCCYAEILNYRYHKDFKIVRHIKNKPKHNTQAFSLYNK